MKEPHTRPQERDPQAGEIQHHPFGMVGIVDEKKGAVRARCRCVPFLHALR